MKSAIERNVLLALVMLPCIKPSLPPQQNCPVQTVMCLENKKQTETRRQSPQSSVSWNCSLSIHVYNCKDKTLDGTRMCCEFSIKKKNKTLSAGPASCIGNQTVRSWHCYWEFASLRILSIPGSIGDTMNTWSHALYYDCKTPNSTSYIQNCSDFGLTTKTETSPSFRPLNNTTSPKPAHTYQSNTTPVQHSTAKSTQPGNFSTAKPTQPGNFSTAKPTQPGNFSTAKPTQPGNFSTAKPTQPGNFSTAKPTQPGNFSTAKPIQPGNFSTAKPTQPGNFSAAKTTQPGNVNFSTTKQDTTDEYKLSGINTRFRALGKSLTEKVSHFNCTSYWIQTVLGEIEDKVRQFLRDILKANVSVEQSFSNQTIEINVVVTRDFNGTMTIPAEADKPLPGSVRIPPGSIDVKHGRLGIVTVVFHFEGLCNNTEERNMATASSNGYLSLQSPTVSVLAMSPEGDIKALEDNASITFGPKIRDRSSPECMFLNRKDFWSFEGMALLREQNANYTTCLTDHFTSFAVLIDYDKDSPKNQPSQAERLALDLITKIGCGISLVCLLACIITFACVRNLSAKRYRIHLNLCIALAAAQLLFLGGIEATNTKGVCIAVAVMLHYFFTASFSWMCIEAIQLFTTIVSVFNLQEIRMRYYLAVGWGIPAIIVIITVSVDYNGYTTPERCWLSLEGDFIWAFIAPVIIIISINIAVLIAVVVVRVSLKGNPLTPSENKKVAAALKTVMVLFPLLGLCWVFGLMAVVTKRRPFLYTFVVLSSLQGAFIFLFQCIGSSEVRGSIRAAKHRYSLESSIRHEQKSNRESNNGKNSERKILLIKLTISHQDKNDNQKTATEV